MKNQLNSILKFTGFFFISLILLVIADLVGGDLEGIIKEQIGENYYLPTLLVIGFIAALIFTLWNDGGHFFKQKDKELLAEKISDKDILHIRQGLLKSYQNRIDQKLAYRFPINLELKYSLEGTTSKALLYDNETIQSTKIEEKLISLFDKHNGRLLIIGEPGSGKTTLLLQLAIQLLEREEQQIPIIINIATWRPRFNNIQEWLIELLPQMGFSKSLAQQIITENWLLPLFDGLDELAEEQRGDCLNAIAQYGALRKAHYVICSRVKEYTSTIDAPVYCQIMVKPLTLTQIRKGLESDKSPETRGILHAIKKDALIAEAVKIPFYLNTVQFLFASSKVWEEYGFKAESLEERKVEIVEIFVEQSASIFQKHPTNKVKKWLAFLSNRMNKNQLVVFELLDLQYKWLNLTRMQRFISWLIGGLIGGLIERLIVGLIFGFIFGLTVGLIFGLIFGLMVVLIFGLICGLIFGLFEGLIEGIKSLNDNTRLPIVFTKDDIRLRDILSTWRNNLVVVLIFGLMGGLIGGLFIVLIGGLMGGLFIVLIFGLFDVLKDNYTNFIQINKPYHRFRASAKRFHFSILQHRHLRYLLYKKDLLPLKLIPFLDELSKNHLLEINGGTWRFRHRILQDYFAELWEREYAEEHGEKQK